jgi:hypothetical protein
MDVKDLIYFEGMQWILRGLGQDPIASCCEYGVT